MLTIKPSVVLWVLKQFCHNSKNEMSALSLCLFSPCCFNVCIKTKCAYILTTWHFFCCDSFVSVGWLSGEYCLMSTYRTVQWSQCCFQIILEVIQKNKASTRNTVQSVMLVWVGVNLLTIQANKENQNEIKEVAPKRDECSNRREPFELLNVLWMT